MIRARRWLTIESDESLTSSGTKLETLFHRRERVAGLIECKGEGFWLNDPYEILSWQVCEGIYKYVLEEVER